MSVQEISELTKATLDEWEYPYGWAPDTAALRVCEAMKPWMAELTDCLAIWEEKGLEMNEGELILGKANLGALIESWLKFFYCVYFEDYSLRPIADRKKGGIVEPGDLSFERLKQYSRGIVWEQGDDWDLWVEKIQQQRNAIHAFNSRSIGTNAEFLDDCDKYYEFLQKVISHLPDSPKWAFENYQ